MPSQIHNWNCLCWIKIWRTDRLDGL